MKTENSILMKQARESLVGNWPKVIGAFAIYMLASVSASAIPKSGGLISLLVSGPLALGLALFTLSFSRKNNPHIDQIFFGFKRFSFAFSAYFLVVMFTLLWVLLLIVPGIIASISYSMTFFIMSDDPSISPLEAIKKSKKMMYGYKMKYFTLQLRFIGWAILSVLTLGIGFLWLIPYVHITMAKFYDDLKSGGEEIEVVKI